MADKAISELLAANQVTPTDLFVLEQSGTAKKLTGQTLENWLLSFADGHGGIHSIVKANTSGLKDTYRITFADTTTFDFVVTNGKSVISITKSGTSGLVDTYTIKYNDGTSSTFTVTNGAKGDQGDNTYTHIKFASQEPTEASHSFGDVPDKWIGFYWGNSSAAPTDWTQYKWYQFKGDQGATGLPATLVNSIVEYQVGTSGTVVPSEAWSTSVPTVPQSKYLWTRVTTTFNTGAPIVSYSVSRMGLDGLGSVVSINNIAPNAEGNIHLVAADVGARDNTWMPSASDIKDGILPIERGGTGAADAPTARAYLGLTPYFRAYYVETSASSELEMLQYNWKDWDTGAFLVFFKMGGNYRGLVGMKANNEYGSVIELSYDTGSIYKYRLNGGTWYEHQHSA